MIPFWLNAAAQAAEDLPMSNVVEITKANVPTIPESGLPTNYVAARMALERCESEDECKVWMDDAAKAQAYAAMKDDAGLFNLARRIQARAARRLDEILRRHHPSNPAENLKRNTAEKPTVGMHASEVDSTPKTRTEADARLGLSSNESKTVRAIGAMPAAAFEAAVEAPRAPSLSGLAAHSRTLRTTIVRDPSFADSGVFAQLQQHQALKAFAEFCESADPISLASTVSSEECETVRGFITIAERWLEQFVDNLPANSW